METSRGISKTGFAALCIYGTYLARVDLGAAESIVKCTHLGELLGCADDILVMSKEMKCSRCLGGSIR